MALNVWVHASIELVVIDEENYDPCGISTSDVAISRVMEIEAE
jgi:hypothetical protein